MGGKNVCDFSGLFFFNVYFSFQSCWQCVFSILWINVFCLKTLCKNSDLIYFTENISSGPTAL